MENQQLTINDIKTRLKSQDNKVRKNAVLFLARIDKPEVISLLKPLLEDPSEDIRNACEKIISFLSKKYNQSQDLIAQQEKQKIKNKIETSSFDPNTLLQLIITNDVKVKIASIMSFYGVKNEQVLITFKKFLQIETDETVIATYIKAIGSIGNSEEIEFIKKYLSHSDSRVKSNTIEALSELGAYEEIIDDILPLIESNDERLKITAIQYLSRIDIDVLLNEFTKKMTLNTNNLKNAILKICMQYEVEKTLNFYKNNFEYLTQEQQMLVINYLQKYNNKKEVEEFLITKGYSNKEETNINELFEILSNQDKSIFEIEDELKKEDDFYYKTGLKFLKIKNFSEAISEFNNAIKINPKHFQAWRERGKAFIEMENYNNAIYCLDKAIILAPDDIDTWQYKGTALAAVFKDDEAEICFNKVKHLKSKSEIPTSKIENKLKIETNSKIPTVQPLVQEETDLNQNKLNNNKTSNKVDIDAEKIKKNSSDYTDINKKLLKNNKHCPKCKKETDFTIKKCECGYEFIIVEPDNSQHANDINKINPIPVKNQAEKNLTVEKNKKCHRCGHENFSEQKSCSKCGLKFLITEQPSNQITNNTKSCPECGFTVNDNNINTCPECGFEFNSNKKNVNFTNDITVKNISSNQNIPKNLSNSREIYNKTCPECGFIVNDNINICPECGFELQDQASNLSINHNTDNTITCPECGFTVNDNNINTCPECGFAFD